MKRIAIALVIAAACALVGWRAARAAATDPPTSMDPLKAARLDGAVAHYQAIMEHASAEAAPFAATIRQLCEEAKIAPQDLLSGTVKVTVETGAITRPAPPPAKK